MVKKSGVYCDLCDDPVTRSDRWFSMVFSPIKARLYYWGITDNYPVTSGWVRSRLDLCEGCKREVFEEVQSRVGEQ